MRAIGEPQRRGRPRWDFTPADEANEPFDTAAPSEQARAPADTDDQRRPELPGFLRDRANESESTVRELRKELSARCIQIADLHNIRQQQAAALMVARAAIESLEASTTALKKTVTQRDNEIAAAQYELRAANQNKKALVEKLEATELELAELLQKQLHLATELNDKEVALISAEERVAALEQELAADTAQDEATQEKPAQEPVLVPAPTVADAQQQLRSTAAEQSIQFESQLKRIESMLAAGGEKLDKLNAANARLSARSDALDKSQAQFESRIKTLESALASRDEQIDQLTAMNTKLSERCNAPVNNNILLESGRTNGQERFKSRTGDIKLAEAALCSGHKTAEQKIAELTSELLREREEHAAAERASAAIRGELALLLSKLTATTPSIQ